MTAPADLPRPNRVDRLFFWFRRSADAAWQLAPLLTPLGCIFGHGRTLGQADAVGQGTDRGAWQTEPFRELAPAAGIIEGQLCRIGKAYGPYWYGVVRNIEKTYSGGPKRYTVKIQCEGEGGILDDAIIHQAWEDVGGAQPLGFVPPFGPKYRSASTASVATSTVYVHGNDDNWTRDQLCRFLALTQAGALGTAATWGVSVTGDGGSDDIPTMQLTGYSVAAALSNILDPGQGRSWRMRNMEVRFLDLATAGSALYLTSDQVPQVRVAGSADRADYCLAMAPADPVGPVWLEWHQQEEEATPSGELALVNLGGGPVFTFNPLQYWGSTAAAAIIDDVDAATGTRAARTANRTNPCWLSCIPLENETQVFVGSIDVSKLIKWAPLPTIASAPTRSTGLALQCTAQDWEALKALITPAQPLRIRARIQCGPPLQRSAITGTGDWPRIPLRTRMLRTTGASTATLAALATRETQPTKKGAAWIWPGQLLADLLPGDRIEGLYYDDVFLIGPLIVESVAWKVDSLGTYGTHINCMPVAPGFEVTP
jgi:hypothetical protein